MKKNYFCCACSSRRIRNLIVLDHDSKVFYLCLRCYILHIIAGYRQITKAIIQRTYEEARADKEFSYRYGSILPPKVENQLVQHFRKNFSKKPFEEKGLRASLKRLYQSFHR
jgi:hypothetical protein